jgi:hypothetical protein
MPKADCNGEGIQVTARGLYHNHERELQMNGILIAAVAASAVLFLVLRRRRKKTRVQMIQERADDLLEELTRRISDMRDEARKASGRARKELNHQAKNLESRERELRKRFDGLSSEARKILEKARSG